MPVYRKKSGKHHYRGEDGEIHVVKAGETIECEKKFLGSAISTFKKVGEGKVKGKGKEKTPDVNVGQGKKEIPDLAKGKFKRDKR